MRIGSHATVLLVEDVARSATYYRDKLGCDVAQYDALPEHYGFAERDALSVHFACYDGVQPRPNSAAVPPDMFDLYAYPDDVDALYAELAERGADLLGPPVEEGYGMYDFRVRDPDGYILAFGRPL